LASAPGPTDGRNVLRRRNAFVSYPKSCARSGNRESVDAQ
jgi:hypothetical protein